MKQITLLAIYRIVYKCALIYAKAFLAQKDKKIEQHFLDRETDHFVIKNKSQNLRKPFWIHASSGEIEYAKPLIREIKRRHPTDPILVTYSSPSAVRIIEKMDEVDIYGPLPFDLANPIQLFLLRFKPKALFIARTDVWLELSNQVEKFNIPSILFSATFAKNSSRLKKPILYFTKFALNKLSLISCVSEEDLQNIGELETPIYVDGDTRFDQVFYRLDHAHSQTLRDDLKMLSQAKYPILISGSTWPEDESVLLPAMAQIKKHSTNLKQMKFIIAPHELTPAHLESLTHQLKELNLTYSFYSEQKVWQEDVLIIDQMGILAELYQTASFAFVGGSFKKQVHSVMEALAAGLNVIVGPHHHNNREALVFKAIGFVTEVNSVESFVNTLERLNKISASKAQIRNRVRKLQGASNKIIERYNQLGF